MTANTIDMIQEARVLLLAIVLLCLGIGLVVLEVLLPSGGLISVLATGAFVGALVLGFMESTTTGVIFIAVIIVCLPITVAWSFKFFPRTAIGKKTILNPTVETPAQRGTAGVSDEDYTALIGKKGVAITPLRPSGIALIDDKRYSVVTSGALLDKNTPIVVTEIQGNSIVVEPC
jgi:membrane-bound serine protease (ClpP class)